MKHIKTAFEEGIFQIILNRPSKKNAIRVQMLVAIAEAVAEAETTSGARVIILRGEGDNFSSGLDVSSLGGIPELFGDDWTQHSHRITRLWQDSIHSLQQSTLPVIALLASYTLGAGLELALGADLRIAAEDALLSLEEARLGMIPDAGGTTRLTQLAGASRAKELIFTGRRIDAATAQAWGLVNKVVPKESLWDEGLALAKEMMECAPLAVSAAKRTINAIENTSQGFQHEMTEQNRLFHTQDIIEGMQAAAERRPPNWKGE